MPYINQKDRSFTSPNAFGMPSATGPGVLNYQLTECVGLYLHEHGLNYRTINDIIGALEGAKLEFYRRIAAPYEDTKIKENGDVY